MEKTEITLDRPAYGRALPPTAQEKPLGLLDKLRPTGQLLLLALLGILWGNTTVFQVLNPFGLGYVAAFWLTDRRFVVAAASVAAGLCLGGAAENIKYISCVLVLILLHFALQSRIRMPVIQQRALTGAVVTFLSGAAYAAIQGGSFFYLVIAIAEALAVFFAALVLAKGTSLISKGLKQRILAQEEAVSLAFLFGGAAAGGWEWTIPYLNIPLMLLLSTAMILTAGFRGGAGIGAASGVLIGFFLLMTQKAGLPLLCALALGGLLCGSVKELGRLAVALAFLCAVFLVLFYENPDVLQAELLGGLGLGCLLFLLIPRKSFSFFNTYAGQEGACTTERYAEKVKDMTKERLAQFSTAFHGLAKSFRGAAVPDVRKELLALTDRIAERACKHCGLTPYCWDSNFYHTYQVTVSALSCCEQRGYITPDQLPEPFCKNCVRPSAYVDAVNRVYESGRMEQRFAAQLTECRQLVGEQLSAVGDLMTGLTDKLDVRMVFLANTEKEILSALEKEGVPIKEVTVFTAGTKEAVEVILTLRTCHQSHLCKNTLIPVVSRILGRPMRKAAGQTACLTGATGLCTLHLLEEKKFALSAAVAACPKREGDVSGDSTAFLETPGGTAIMALSDGMGTGKTARIESQSAIELLEQFMEAGFEKELAIQMINSALLLRSTQESFATLDICSVDLYSGAAEFLKIGAPSAYLLRDERVIAIRAYTLPVGILRHIAPHKNDMQLKDGDVILLVSDGITELMGGETEDVAWLSEIFSRFRSNNPQSIADYVLLEAEKTLTGGERRDDMTVMAGRFWKRA